MFGKRLRLARKRAGLSMRSLAERMEPKVSAQAISKYEAGKMMPSSAVLVGLGKALDVSLDFLMSAQVEALDGLEFRKHSSASARDRAKAEAVLIDNLERYLTIEEVLGIPSSGNSFQDRCYDSVATEGQIDETADKLRNAWDLGMDPVPSLCALLEEKGIKVVEADLPERISGLACRVMRNGRVVADAVVVSKRTNVERKRLTLAHELAHRIIRSTGNPAIKLEAAMNRFAGAFLVPGRHLIEKAEQAGTASPTTRSSASSTPTASRQRPCWSASAKSASCVLLRSERAFRTFARSWRKTEPEPIPGNQGFAAFEKPQRFKQLVWRAVGEELISPVRAAALLNDSLDAVERQITGPAIQ